MVVFRSYFLQMFVHDFAAWKVAVIKMDYTEFLVAGIMNGVRTGGD